MGFFSNLFGGGKEEDFSTYKPETKNELRALIMNPEVYLGDIDISKIHDLSGIFSKLDYTDKNMQKTNFRNPHLMENGKMSYGLEGLEKWDVSHVEDFSDMFEGNEFLKADCAKLFDEWKPLKGERFRGMFKGCKNLSNINLRKFRSGKNKKINMADLRSMFEGCTTFYKEVDKQYQLLCDKIHQTEFKGDHDHDLLMKNKIVEPNSLAQEMLPYPMPDGLYQTVLGHERDLNAFLGDPAKCDLLTEGFNFGTLDVSAQTNFNDFFHNSRRKGFLGVDKWDTENLRSMQNFAFNCPGFGVDLSNWQVEKLENLDFAFAHSTPDMGGKDKQPYMMVKGTDKWITPVLKTCHGTFMYACNDQPDNLQFNPFRFLETSNELTDLRGTGRGMSGVAHCKFEYIDLSKVEYIGGFMSEQDPLHNPESLLSYRLPQEAIRELDLSNLKDAGLRDGFTKVETRSGEILDKTYFFAGDLITAKISAELNQNIENLSNYVPRIADMPYEFRRQTSKPEKITEQQERIAETLKVEDKDERKDLIVLAWDMKAYEVNNNPYAPMGEVYSSDFNEKYDLGACPDFLKPYILGENKDQYNLVTSYGVNSVSVTKEEFQKIYREHREHFDNNGQIKVYNNYGEVYQDLLSDHFKVNILKSNAADSDLAVRRGNLDAINGTTYHSRR